MANPGWGLRINGARCDRGMSQIELAAALNTHQQNVSRWEREQATPHKRVFEALALALGCSADWLLWGGLEPQVRITHAQNIYELPAEAWREATPQEVERHLAAQMGRKRS